MMTAHAAPSVEVSAVAVFCALCLLLFIGNAARARITLLQRLYLPSSVVGGLIGLLVVSILGTALPEGARATFDAHVKLARNVPGFLINVIFATLFLGKALPRMKTVVRLAFPQVCVGQIMAWGQYVGSCSRGSSSARRGCTSSSATCWRSASRAATEP